MSKTKTDRSWNFLYSIVMALMAILIPVAAYFGNLFHIVVNSPVLGWLGQAQGNKQDTGDTITNWSLNRFMTDIFPNLDLSSSGSEKSVFWQAIEPIKVALIFTLIFFVLAILISVVLFVLAWFVKKKKASAIVAGAGILSLIGMIISFNFVAIPLTDGSMPLGSFFSSVLGLFMSTIANLTYVRLTTGYYIMLFLFIGVLLWIGSYALIELGEKEKHDKKHN